jgi:perosamine synthetase
MNIPHSKPLIGKDGIEAVSRVLASGRIAQGEEVAAFEEECATLAGRRYGVAVNSGTAALHLALIGLGVGEGDKVLLPSYACAALAQAVTWQRACPLLCDIGPDYNLCPEANLGEAQAVIVPHMFGAPARVPAHENVVEDLAQAFGGPVGHTGRVTMTSFYATKLFTTGEGGMLFTDDLAIAEMARDRRDYDNRDDFVPRYAYKMTDFQAALGREQLRSLPDFIERRREIAQQYTEAFSKLPLRLPKDPGHVFFRYVVATPRRDALEHFLQALGVEAKRPVYRPAHHSLGGVFPASEQAHHECLSIPVYPAMTPQEVGYVIELVVQFFCETTDRQTSAF